MTENLPPTQPCTDPRHTGRIREQLGCTGPDPAEPTHMGPDPSHGGLTTHRGRREDCTGPDCAPAADRLVFGIYRTSSGALQAQLTQLDANDSGHGYRLAGPKHYNRGVTPLLEKDLDERDAQEIRAMLDAVFPATDAPATA